MRNTFHINPEQFEKDLKNDTLKFIPDRSAAYYKLPSLVECYWDVLEENFEKYFDSEGQRIIPHQETFTQQYLKRVDSNQYSNSVMNGIRGRALRAYPSLVRESHFVSLTNVILANLQIDATIVSETDLDMERGVDLALIMEGTSFSISITKNDDATDWYAIKQERKQGIKNPHPIKVVVKQSNIYEVGKGKNPFWLFKPSKVEETIKKCKEVVELNDT